MKIKNTHCLWPKATRHIDFIHQDYPPPPSYPGAGTNPPIHHALQTSNTTTGSDTIECLDVTRVSDMGSTQGQHSKSSSQDTSSLSQVSSQQEQLDFRIPPAASPLDDTEEVGVFVKLLPLYFLVLY